ncbi:hypothetical protein G9A89_017795 [Geosiphon pyriformis]|nr:hypothetical protein G9A89_017795 [Geosiphon pyriformis]
MTINKILFQSKQKKAKLLETYGNFFEGFKSQSPMPLGIQLPPLQPDFGAISPWEITDSKEEESSDQKVNKQNPILKNSEIKTLQQSQQQPMAYASIAKIKKFTGKEDNTQVWLNNVEKAIAANGWNDDRAFQAISYFLQNTTNSNNNSINHLANTFTTIKQGKTEAVATYLRCFHKNLCQIQAIQADYFTVPQILNQFIHGLCSSFLQCVCPMHSQTLQNTVTNARDFELAELEANHAQVINLVINKSFDLDSKLKQLSESINQKLKGYLADNHAIY